MASAAPSLGQPSDLRAKAEAGKHAMGAGRFEEAASLYAEVVKALPDEPGMRLNLGMAQAMAGRPADAVPHLEAALKLQPGLLPAALFLGTAQMQLGRPARAVAPLEKVLAADPAQHQAREMLADALAALERWEPASRHYLHLAEVHPDHARFWYGLGRSYEAMAGAAFDRLRAAAPDSVWLLLLTAEGLAAGGRHANAFALFREVLARKPGLREPHEGLAAVYEAKGHAEWAATERARAQAVREPACGQAPLRCAFRSGRYEAVLAPASGPASPERDYWRARAAGELARAAFVHLDRLPASPERALVKAEVLLRGRRPVDAAAELRQAAELWPQDARLPHALARALHGARDFAGARPLLEELRQRDGADPELAFLLGDTLVQLQQIAPALPLLEQAVRAHPGDLPARAALGRALAQAGEPGRAVPHLVAAAGTDTDGALHYQLARAYQATGQEAAAAKALERSQQLREAAQARQAQAEAEFQITPP